MFDRLGGGMSKRGLREDAGDDGPAPGGRRPEEPAA